jgi:hypothetical protein
VLHALPICSTKLVLLETKAQSEILNTL